MADIDWFTIKGFFYRSYNLLMKYYVYILSTIVILYIFYYIYSYYYELKRRYNCLSLNNLFNGKINKCFAQQPEYCKDMDIDLYWGWCEDPDYLGVYAGDINGPYGFTCNRWITDKKKCPPLQCQGTYPIGLKVDNSKGEIQTYGWCADVDVNRAILGSICGPSPEENAKCKNWIWDSNKCPLTCPVSTLTPITPTVPVEQKIQPSGKCSILCGYKNGHNIPCPPPDCQSKPETCQCK